MNRRDNALIWAQLIIGGTTLMVITWIALEMMGVA